MTTRAATSVRSSQTTFQQLQANEHYETKDFSSWSCWPQNMTAHMTANMTAHMLRSPFSEPCQSLQAKSNATMSLQRPYNKRKTIQALLVRIGLTYQHASPDDQSNGLPLVSPRPHPSTPFTPYHPHHTPSPRYSFTALPLIPHPQHTVMCS